MSALSAPFACNCAFTFSHFCFGRQLFFRQRSQIRTRMNSRIWNVVALSTRNLRRWLLAGVRGLVVHWRVHFVRCTQTVSIESRSKVCRRYMCNLAHVYFRLWQRAKIWRIGERTLHNLRIELGFVRCWHSAHRARLEATRAAVAQFYLILLGLRTLHVEFESCAVAYFIRYSSCKLSTRVLVCVVRRRPIATTERMPSALVDLIKVSCCGSLATIQSIRELAQVAS